MDNYRNLAEKVNRSSQELIDAIDNVQSIKHRLTQIEDGATIEAELSLVLNNNKRSHKRYWLTKDEVFNILTDRLRFAEAHLKEKQKSFK